MLAIYGHIKITKAKEPLFDGTLIPCYILVPGIHHVCLSMARNWILSANPANTRATWPGQESWSWPWPVVNAMHIFVSLYLDGSQLHRWGLWLFISPAKTWAPRAAIGPHCTASSLHGIRRKLSPRWCVCLGQLLELPGIDLRQIRKAQHTHSLCYLVYFWPKFFG